MKKYWAREIELSFLSPSFFYSACVADMIKKQKKIFEILRNQWKKKILEIFNFLILKKIPEKVFFHLDFLFLIIMRKIFAMLTKIWIVDLIDGLWRLQLYSINRWITEELYFTWKFFRFDYWTQKNKKMPFRGSVRIKISEK